MDYDIAPKMTDTDLLDLASRRWRTGEWFEREGYAAIERGHFFIIHNRTDPFIYLCRFWLNIPKRDERNDKEWESADSTLLQFFARGDDDAALHDHPWPFRTRLLKGGYVEHLPPADWQPGSDLGPEWDQNTVVRWTDDSIAHEATDLHCVGHVRPGSWTLVNTGPRVRPWGFHPPGRLWVPWREYLDERNRDAPTSRLERLALISA